MVRETAQPPQLRYVFCWMIIPYGYLNAKTVDYRLVHRGVLAMLSLLIKIKGRFKRWKTLFKRAGNWQQMALFFSRLYGMLDNFGNLIPKTREGQLMQYEYFFDDNGQPFLRDMY